MHHSRTVMAVAAAVLASLVVAACGSGGSGSESQSSSPSSSTSSSSSSSAAPTTADSSSTSESSPTSEESSPTSEPAPSISMEPAEVNLAFGFLLNAAYGGFYVADADGDYADNNLTVNMLAGGPNAPAPEVSLSSGEAQIGIEANTSRLMSYLAKSDDIVIIGQKYQQSPNGLLSLASKPVQEPADLVGIKVLAGAPNRPSIDALMNINNVTDYTFVPAGADVGPLMGGEGDALLSFANNQPITLEQKFGLKEGSDFFFTPFSEFGYHLMSDVVIVYKPYLESHRDAVVRFMAATIQGWEKQLQDPAAGVDLAVTKYGAQLGLDAAQQLALAQADVPYITSDLTQEKGLFYVDADYVQNKIYPSLEKGGVTGMPAAESIIDMSVLDDAYALLGK